MPSDEFKTVGDLFKRDDFREFISRAFAAPETGHAGEAIAPDETCGNCHDGGYLRRDVQPGHVDFGRLVECPCGLIETRRRLRIWKSSQIPPTMTGWTLDSWQALPQNADKSALVQQLREWIEGERWLLLVGDVGLGKTGLAISLLMEWVHGGKSGLYVVTPSFLSRIRATYRERGDDADELEVLGSAISAPLLVLDDLGKVKLSEWGQEKLFTLVNERYLAGRRTIVTSNLDVEDGALEGHLWPATWDRLRGMADVVKLTGDSLR